MVVVGGGAFKKQWPCPCVGYHMVGNGLVWSRFRCTPFGSRLKIALCGINHVQRNI